MSSSYVLFEEILNISKVEIKLRDNCAGEKETFHLPECSKESAAQKRGYPSTQLRLRPAVGPLSWELGEPVHRAPLTRLSLYCLWKQLRVASLSSPFCARRPRSAKACLAFICPPSQTQSKSTGRSLNIQLCQGGIPASCGK